MKITKIETLVCNARMRNWIFVKIHTDQPGLHGWGEATLEWHTRSVVGAIEDISQLLIGEDPRRVEHLWQMMYRQHFWHGNGIVRGTAISGIDLALWDIVGKVHGVPSGGPFSPLGIPRQGPPGPPPPGLGGPGSATTPGFPPPGGGGGWKTST